MYLCGWILIIFSIFPTHSTFVKMGYFFHYRISLIKSKQNEWINECENGASSSSMLKNWWCWSTDPEGINLKAHPLKEWAKYLQCNPDFWMCKALIRRDNIYWYFIAAWDQRLPNLQGLKQVPTKLSVTCQLFSYRLT